MELAPSDPCMEPDDPMATDDPYQLEPDDPMANNCDVLINFAEDRDVSVNSSGAEEASEDAHEISKAGSSVVYKPCSQSLPTRHVEMF